MLHRLPSLSQQTSQVAKPSVIYNSLHRMPSLSRSNQKHFLCVDVDQTVIVEGAHEEVAPEEGAHEEGAHEEAVDEEVADEEPFDEVAADEELVDEESLQHPPALIDIAYVEDDEVISHVQLLVVEPLNTCW
ncbi:hypothetical protein V8G54_023834 [Vigna mungo]|uniref:Uncharacterized protein n=1 Tax=Vigna mungo TaxID=3915 RepID=A0AAQ3N660_VIGMU